MNAKQIPFQHDKKGLIRLGDLSKNELCKYIAAMAQQNQLLMHKLDVCQAEYAKHLESTDSQ